MSYETIVGRNKDDLEKYKDSAVGFIGKHIVGTGEDAHLTTRVMFDLIRPHVTLITGKRGTGKSYVAGVLVEEALQLPEEFRKNMSIVIIDTMGIFWSMKYPNDQQIQILEEWKMQPQAMQNVKVFAPTMQMHEFEAAGIPVDHGMSIAPYEFSAEDWLLAFNLSRTDPVGVSLEKNINQLFERGEKFAIEDIINKIKDDNETSDEVKNALENLLTVANQWGVFGEEGANIDYMIQPGQVSVVDISKLRTSQAWSVRNLLVALIARRIYQIRLTARKEEEIAKITGEPLKNKQPMIWMIIDEAHNFIPSEYDTVSSEPLKIISKQGREPGVSLTVITQMPNKVHQDILSQTDVVISHRLTSKDDLNALHSVMQTYHSEDLWKYINTLPRWPGAAIILDDNLEKVFTVDIRPRLSWHAGGTAVVI
jgi:DNA helicase HerA-like ATPase